MKALGAARKWALLSLDCDAGVAQETVVVQRVDELIAMVREQEQERWLRRFVGPDWREWLAQDAGETA